MNESFFYGEPVFLPVLPLKNVVALPKSIIPVIVGREISINAVDFAMRENKEIFVTAQQITDTENPTINDLYHHGTRALILQVSRMPNGTLKILIEGISRAIIMEEKESSGFLSVMTKDIVPVQLEHTSDNLALWRNLYDLFKEYVHLNEKISADMLGLFRGLDDIDYLADTIAVQMHLSFKDRQHILEIANLKERSLQLAVFLQKEIEIIKAEKSIRKRVQSQVEKHQKDYYLNEQMRAIQRELGRDDYQQEINDIRKRAKKLKLSAEAYEKVDSELNRLEQMQPTSPEASVCRNYVEWLLSIPWHSIVKDSVSMQEAERLLNESHAGMKKPKERVIEFLAARKFAGDALKRAPIICLVGPPGVGKTSLAQSIAKALGRPFVRLSLGGLRDEAEIRGHRRTYIGAMPGKIIQAMKKAKVLNPVILLDEIDKMSMDFRGDPASALLEVLDPEQNKAFGDHFLEVEYDLSKIMFVTTANVFDGIPYPLLDRMEIITLSGYTDQEKLAIAKQFLLPKLLAEHNIKPNQIEIADTILALIIDEYSKEAGVRQLERIIAKILRKSILQLLTMKKKKAVVIDAKCIEEWLGAPPFRKDERLFATTDTAGVATGLAWTEVGGDVLDIEVTVMKGKGALTLTGQLGEVMQESAQAAMSYIRSRAKDFGLEENFYADVDVHIHVPEGAIPKDGPSAGITMAVALLSALTHTPVRRDVAMTGEVTLRGRVLQIGGLKEKLLAATRFGITTVIVPKSNQKDIKEFENELDLALSVIYANHMDEVLAKAFASKPFLTSIKKQSSVKKTAKKVNSKK